MTKPKPQPSAAEQAGIPAAILKIEYRDVAKLSAYESNARTHSESQVGQIAESIRTFGFVNPCLIRKDGTLIAGHGRLAAALRLGMKTVPVIVLDHLTPTQARALVIADNKLALNAGWDDDVLRAEFDALVTDGFDLAITGFADDEIHDLLASDRAGADDTPVSPDEFPSLDDSIATDYKCPSCGYQWSGKPK